MVFLVACLDPVQLPTFGSGKLLLEYFPKIQGFPWVHVECRRHTVLVACVVRVCLTHVPAEDATYKFVDEPRRIDTGKRGRMARGKRGK